jgi:hypothetical protein
VGVVALMELHGLDIEQIYYPFHVKKGLTCERKFTGSSLCEAPRTQSGPSRSRLWIKTEEFEDVSWRLFVLNLNDHCRLELKFRSLATPRLSGTTLSKL